MLSHTLRLLLVGALLPLVGCGSLKKVEEQVVQPVQQPVPVKKAPTKKAPVAKPRKVVVAPVVATPVVHTPSEGNDGGGGGGGDSGSPW
ncbi:MULTISPECIES: hypothetical protein [Hyphomicrobiales]|jgi:hypothetical protein|uniref:hypothetical protein n=1 Tax=Hyphomicrobiales TaxID=356 RepID=UPI0012FA322F|nr:MULTISPECIES: hypothetical protein [Phyllobacteriaceae]MCX8570598.1 hypothetical protein [Aminobacter sp. MET-1]